MTLRFGDFELFSEGYELRRRGRPVHLEPRVFEVLRYLARHRDRVVPKEELLAELWPEEFVTEGALVSAIRDARRALGDTGAARRWIETVHGRGFRFRGAGVSESGAAPEAPDPPAEAAPRSIAVLPLEDLNRAENDAWFAAGMTDALITELTNIGSLRVVSRTSVLRFQGSRAPLREIGRALAVDLVVEGTVLRVEDRVRTTVQVVRVATDEHLWARSYDREMRDVLRLQGELASAIAREIDVELTPREERRLASLRQVDPEVYLLVLQGRHAVAERREPGFRRAVTCFEQAVARDPSYAPAHAGLADAWAMLANYGIVPPQEAEGPARRAATRALALDPTSAEAHRTLALLQWQFTFDWEAADREYERAIALDPSSSIVRGWRGTCLGVQGRFDESEAELQRALAIDPLSLHVTALLGWMRYFAGRPKEAIPYYRSVLAVDADHVMARWFLGEALVELGEPKAAAGELERALDLSERASRFLGYLGYARARAGDEAGALAILAELASRGRERYVPAYFPALVHAGLGNATAALAELERAWEQRDTMLRDLLVDPPWRRLRREPQYGQLLERLRLRTNRRP